MGVGAGLGRGGWVDPRGWGLLVDPFEGLGGWVGVWGRGVMLALGRKMLSGDPVSK